VSYPEAWLKSAVEAAAGLKAWPVSVPEGAAVPFACYRRMQTDRERHMGGAACMPPVASFEVELYAEGYTQAKELAERVRLACDTFKGEAGGILIERVDLTDERDGDPVFFEGHDKPTYMVVMVFSVRWIEKYPRS
jgi:hypothetical protein